MQCFPGTGDVPLIADMSSDILSRPIDISQIWTYLCRRSEESRTFRGNDCYHP